jgi:hypothetical protein
MLNWYDKLENFYKLLCVYIVFIREVLTCMYEYIIINFKDHQTAYFVLL